MTAICTSRLPVRQHLHHSTPGQISPSIHTEQRRTRSHVDNNVSLFRSEGKVSNRRDRWHEHVTAARTSIQLSAAFVAHSLLRASPRICSVTPVRVGGEDVNVNPRTLIESNEYWALIIGISCNSSGTAAYTLLPVQLEMYGSTRIRHMKRYTSVDPYDKCTAHSDYVKFAHVNRTTERGRRYRRRQRQPHASA